MAHEAVIVRRPLYRYANLGLAVALCLVLLLVGQGDALADDPEPAPAPEPAATAQPTVEHNTYNIFNFPSVGDALDIVLKGMSDATRKATQPTFATMNLILKTPSLASDEDGNPGQLNFFAIVEPLWRLAALPMAGILGFVLLLYGGVAMQVSAINQSPRGIGANMEGLVASVVGISLAAFSLQVFHLVNEADNVLVDLIMQAPGPGQGTNLATMASGVLSAAGVASPLASMIVAIILLIPTLLLLMMAVARWALFFVVAVLSPLAAVSLGSLPTRRLASLWGQMFLFVMLLGPANAILLRSIQGLYDMSLGSLGQIDEVPRAVASGAVMFGLLSTAAGLNWAAVQRAFGTALGLASTGVSVAIAGVTGAGAVAGAIASGGGLAALGGSLRGVGGTMAGPSGTSASSGLASTAAASSIAASTGSQGSSAMSKGLGGIGPSPQPSASAKDASEAAPETPDEWRESYRARRRDGFDWNRAAIVGGAIAAMAPGPVGRAGMAARLLGMAGMVEDRFNRGVEDRDQVRDENRERWSQADLKEQRGMIFGRPSGPAQVERANAIDRTAASVQRRTSDQEGLRAGLARLGRSALGHSVIGGDAYEGIASLSKAPIHLAQSDVSGQEHAGSEPSRIEQITGLYLEAELMSRGTLRGEPVYATGKAGALQVETAGAESIGRSIGLNDGSQWQGIGKDQAEQTRGQVLTLAQRLNAVGQLPHGRAYAEELGRDASVTSSAEALARLEAFVQKAEGDHQTAGHDHEQSSKGA